MTKPEQRIVAQVIIKNIKNKAADSRNYKKWN